MGQAPDSPTAGRAALPCSAPALPPGWAKPSAGRRQGAAPSPALAALALCEPLPAEVAALTNLMPVEYRAGVQSISSRAGAELGGTTEKDDAFWRDLECDDEALSALREVVLEEVCPEARGTWEQRLAELLAPPLVELRARAATFRRLKSDRPGDCWNRCVRWDAVPLTSRLRVELAALDWLAEYRINTKRGVEPDGDAALACPICMCGVSSEGAREEDVTAGRAVRLAMYSPCYHKACTACLAREALASAARARGLSDDKRVIQAQLESPGAAAEVAAAVHVGHLRCPLCSAVVQWPWNQSEPLFKDDQSMPGRD